MVRVVICAVAALLAWPQQVQGQVCRRICRSGEVRDANRCCVSASKLRKRYGYGNVRIEADVRRARVRVAGRWRRVSLPATLRRIPAGRRTLLIRAGKRSWRTSVVIRARTTTRVFASLTGKEWLGKPGDAKRARAIIDAAVRAKGGAAAMQRPLTFFGKIDPRAKGNKQNSYVMSWVSPGRLHWSVTTRQGNGRRTRTEIISPGFRSLTTSGAGGSSARQLKTTKADLDLLWRYPEGVLLRAREPDTRVALLPATKVGGDMVDVIQVAGRGGRARARLYIARTSHMLRRVESINPKGAFKLVAELSDYRKASGLMLAHRWTFKGARVLWNYIRVAKTSSSGTLAPKPLPGRRRPTVRVFESMVWHGLSPEQASLNNDRTPDFYGLCFATRVEHFPSGKQTKEASTWICGVDGRSLKQLWRIGPLAGVPRLVAIDDRRVLVFDEAKGGGVRARVVDLRSRRWLTRTTIRRTLRNHACVGPRRRQVWLEETWRRGMVVDVRTGKSRAAKRPSWCKRAKACGQAGPRAGTCLAHSTRRRLPKAPGLIASYAFSGDGVRIAVGRSRAGLRRPAAVAWDAKGRQLWSRRIIADARRTTPPRHIDLVAGKLIIAYEVRRGAKVVALSARTGKLLWSRRLPFSSVLRLRATRQRLYIPDGHRRTVVVVDARSGRVVGSFGNTSSNSRRPLRPGER